MLGRYWHSARLCTPLAYKVAAIWWPTGWEPQSPIDVPNCVWRAQGEMDQDHITYPQALAMIRGLNQQSMDRAATMWYVIIAVENESISQSVSVRMRRERKPRFMSADCTSSVRSPAARAIVLTARPTVSSVPRKTGSASSRR